MFLISEEEGGDYAAGRVVRLESSGEILRANQGKVILERKNFSFLIASDRWRSSYAAGDYAEGRVLDKTFVQNSPVEYMLSEKKISIHIKMNGIRL